MTFDEWWTDQRLFTSQPLDADTQQRCREAYEAGYEAGNEDAVEQFLEQRKLDMVFDEALAMTRRAVKETL